jgi:hypothetical protein
MPAITAFYGNPYHWIIASYLVLTIALIDGYLGRLPPVRETTKHP